MDGIANIRFPDYIFKSLEEDWKMKFLLCLLFLTVFPFFLWSKSVTVKSPYAPKVRRTAGGEVYLKINLKRQKGETCNPTSMAMILRHFGLFVSSDKLQKAGKESEAYKNSLYLKKELEKYNMQMIFIPMVKGEERVFACVMRAINCGLPLQWLVDLLKAPEYDIDRRKKALLAKQGPVAGHARIVNGYKFNKKTRRVEELIFTDPWGLRRQEIRLADTGKMTFGFFLVFPKKLDPAIVRFILQPVYGK